MTPKVSIIIPMAAGDNIFEDVVDNVLAQTYENIEVIIVGYGLSDDDQILNEIKQYSSQVKYYKHSSNNISSALNYGIKKATGQYFSWIKSGFKYSPDKTQKQIKVIGNSEKAVVMSNWSVLNENERTIQDNPISSDFLLNPSCFLAFSNDSDTRFNTVTMLFPIEPFKIANFSDDYSPAEDLLLLSRLAVGGLSFKIVSERLVSRYSHLSDELQQTDTIETTLDYLKSEIIKNLSYEEITDFFEGRGQALEHYRKILLIGHSRSAAFLAYKILKGTIVKDKAAASELLLNDLSMLSAQLMGTDAETLIDKIESRTKRKKIMFSTTHWLTGGMERVMSTLFRELKDDYEIFLITPYDERQSQIEIPDYVTSIKISHELFVGNFDSLVLSYALLFEVDVVIGYINMFSRQLNLYNICVGTKIKTIASNHEYYFYPYKSEPHYQVVEKRLNAFKRCDAVVWPNNFSAALCGMYVDHSYTIGNPNNFNVLPRRETTSENNIICVGRFNDYVKRIDRILECFALVLKKVPDAKLMLVGTYDNDAPIRHDSRTSVNDLINKFAIPPSSINFAGEVENVEDYYKKAKVLILTSNSEGFGMVLNEAACFGVPSVANYIPGIEDIIADGENGYITEQDDIGAMTQRLSDILLDDGLQKKLGGNAKTKVKSFDAKHIGDKWRFLISSLLEIQDTAALHKKLNSEIGYKIHDQQLFTKVVSRELNEIFFLAIKEQEKYKINSKTISLLLKTGRLRSRLRANIEYEGLPNTTIKVLTRSYRIARNKLKI